MQNGARLYPPITETRSSRLEVGGGHELRIEECGTPSGIPVVFLHGGPGGGLNLAQARTFDPEAYRIVLFDQRGAGLSTPHASTTDNTTAHLVADIEAIRRHLGIERWLVAGGSWGSCLALAYGEAHPERCLGFRLHGIFLAEPGEIDWWFQGSRTLFPDRWQAFADHVPEDERDRLLEAYHGLLSDPDPDVCEAAAIRLRTFSASTQTFLPEPAHIAKLTEPKAALSVARLFAHYCTQGAFLEPGQLLANIDRVRHLPCEIVQGRYDIVTPVATAWKLHEAWPEARFTLVDEANHAATLKAPALGNALRDAADRLRDAIAEGLGRPLSPPLDAYLRLPAAKSPAVSPDGEVVAYLSDVTGFHQVWMRPLGGGEAQRVVWTDEPVGALSFSPKNRDLVFTMDTGGDERHQLWLLPEAGDAPVALTNAPGVVHAWGAWAPDGKRIAYTCNARDARHMDVVVLDIATREARVVHQDEGYREAIAFMDGGKALLVRDSRRSMSDQDLHRLDLGTGAYTPILPQDGMARYPSLKARKGTGEFYLISDQGGDFLRLGLLSPESGEITWITPERAHDIDAFAPSPDGRHFAYVRNVEGWSRIAIRDVESGAETEVDGLPPGVTASLSWTPDGSALVFPREGSGMPSGISRYDVATNRATAVTQENDRIRARFGFVEPEVERVASFDGLDVPFLVYRPHTPPPASGYPALVVVHGGPEGQWTPSFRADLQYLLAQGILVVAPNVRGSTGYGRRYMSLDDREHRMDSVADLEAIRLWLRGQADVDDDRVGIYGRSYGGFMVLAALTEQPASWRVGVEFYGIANFLTLLQTTGPWREVLRAAEYGDRVADKAMLERFSPIHKADAIRAPLLIVHGMDDPRVPPGESEMIYSRLRGRGHPTEYLRIPHEGHGFARLENRLVVFEAVARFLRRYL
ncbi:prolyl aminopeptidase [Marinivivus vitaminiproducens]|uniref:prolyl aminopeptidase n=1 Tax=Marinivivus vitaminiproducens TaxID=3035935 RepID=UPI002797E74D|nr:prolyl aminopeptidase [Geminicoccaceae bacterium SCSIO 64248]